MKRNNHELVTMVMAKGKERGKMKKKHLLYFADESGKQVFFFSPDDDFE